ncbi:MAG: DUF3368 domain-containing protein [Candidatus Aenigmarchaeota archaeon]|nr:DUF3368 domain-containing protein [Candidatus Aenigmarchaeota archaeon]
MKPLILNSTPLIYLAKAEVLGLIKESPHKKFITPLVYEEVVVNGKERGYPDAFAVEKVIENKIITIKKIKNKKFYDYLLQNPGLHEADAEVLTLAKEMKGILIIDEDVARNVASIEEIENKGTPYILFMLLKKKKVNKKQVREVIEKMIQSGWRCSTEIYVELINQLEKFEE